MDHPDIIRTAFDTLHEEMRRLRRENADLRMRVNQGTAARQLVEQERDDLIRQRDQLRGQCCRQTATRPERAAEPDVSILRARGAL